MTDRFVVLTGASGGIGKCLAKRLIAQHYRVLGIARDASRLQAVADELGENFEPCAFDVSDRVAWQALASRLSAAGQAVDMLICGAGVLPPFAAASTVSSAAVEQTLRINFLSAVYAVEALKAPLLAAAKPMVAVIASAGGIAPLIGTSAYAASKAAMIAYFSALREEWRGRVQVTLLCPGFVKTDIFRSQRHVAGSEKLLNAIAADADRIAGRMLQAIRCGRGYKVLGVDGHLLSIGMRLCPTLTLRLCRYIIKASNLPLFADIWAD